MIVPECMCVAFCDVVLLMFYKGDLRHPRREDKIGHADVLRANSYPFHCKQC